VKLVAGRLGISPRDYEFQMLYGVRRDVQEQLAADGYRIRIYVPFGGQWYPYLMRRMAERPANLLLFLRSLVGG
jgi:proline dehydrogenase